ncbi:MAG: thioredoxin [Thermoplasmata archaeon]
MSDDIVEVSDDNFASVVKSSGKLIVDCWAPWCGPCLMLAPTFEALAKDYKGQVTFAKLDTDKSASTAMSLGISGIPTLIFFKGGEQVERVTGVRPRADIESTMKRVFG